MTTKNEWELNGLEIQACDGHETLIAELYDGMGEGRKNGLRIVRAVSLHRALLNHVEEMRFCLAALYLDHPKIAGEYFGAKLDVRGQELIRKAGGRK